MDTIFALATALGRAGVAVVRLSGRDALSIASALIGPLPNVGEARLRRVRDGAGAVVDEALVLCFAAGRSFTGEDVVEFQLHGASVIVARVQALLAQNGARQADPGEFTRRALENGMLDLTQVEGLSDLLDAETEAQRIQAMRVFSGALGQRQEVWRKDLIRAAALLEATIDFADEDVPEDVSEEVLDLLDRTSVGLKKEVAGARSAERLRSGFEVAILGPPNVGKSSFLNALAGREAAITSNIAGTTRDIVEVRMDLRGLPVTLLDTAGLRETDDTIEQLGIARARERAAQADLRIFLTLDDSYDEGLFLAEDLIVGAQADIVDHQGLSVSSKTGEGLEQVLDQVAELLSNRSSDASLAIRQRQADAMRRSLEFIETARPIVLTGEEVAELAAEEIRRAIHALDALIGRVDVESVLDEIFLSFCLGK